uniref:Uncharacterized protein n=1 Tax=Ditylenchus dipsaci TaxID=166011 RepID=A0A915EFL6_9BILA
MEEASKISSQLQDKIVTGIYSQKESLPTRSSSQAINFLFSAVRLPLLQLINFSGVRAEWQEFWEIFRVAVHENQQLSAAEKFLYLRSLLKKEQKTT